MMERTLHAWNGHCEGRGNCKPGLIRTVVIGLMAISPMLLASCRVTSQSVAHSQQSDDVERLEVIYRAHPKVGTLYSSVRKPASSTGIVQVAAEVPADAFPFQNMSWSKAELRIECPHPDGRSNVARVSLHFRPVECGHECASRSWSQRMDERAGLRQSRRTTFRDRLFYESDESPFATGPSYSEMDLPRPELDAILAELSSHGFFADQGRPVDSEAELEVRLNRRWTSKPWTYEPVLDALTTRVYEEGFQRTAKAEEIAASHQTGLFTRLVPFWHSR